MRQLINWFNNIPPDAIAEIKHLEFDKENNAKLV